MQATIATATPTARSRWGRRIFTALPIALLTLDALIKFANIPEVAEASAKLGLPASLTPVLGAVLLACVALYAIPRTAVLGAVLLTGYLGGAVAIHARVGDPLATHTLFPIYIGALVWGALYLRDARVRALVR